MPRMDSVPEEWFLLYGIKGQIGKKGGPLDSNLGQWYTLYGMVFTEQWEVPWIAQDRKAKEPSGKEATGYRYRAARQKVN